MMENDEKDLYNRQAMSSEESNKAINKNEFMWWLASTIVIVVWGAFFTWMVTSLVDIRDGLLNFLVTFLMCIGSSVYMGAAIYGTHMLHPIRRPRLGDFFTTLMMIPLLGWAIAFALFMEVALVGGGLSGFFFFWPRATYRIIRHKPLLTDVEIDRLKEKGLL